MAFFEMTDQTGAIRPCYGEIGRWVEQVGIQGLNDRLKEAETIFRRIGITFAVYGEGGDPERLIECVSLRCLSSRGDHPGRHRPRRACLSEPRLPA
jgi:uncharacterized circularly permuted ATP-grasp superfamily protein